MVNDPSVHKSENITIELKIGETLKKRKLTQADLSKKADIRPSAISNLARGYVDRVSLDHLEKIARALEVTDINELITINRGKTNQDT
ncbi:hypothetical protein JCM19047_3939 [Bacillus sp. JCM 19047]|nr:hypothetical protein JCM19047_3939 [Bacillus sp. JCM 19047]